MKKFIMKIKLLFFGILSEAVKEEILSISDIEHTDELNKYLQNKYPELKEYTYRIGVNQEIITDNVKLENGDEVALLPPFAGG